MQQKNEEKKTSIITLILINLHLGLNGKENLAAALVACEFGVPLLGAIVDSSQNTTGWIAPGNSKTLKLHFSIPHGESPIALVYEDYINAFLQEVP